MKNNKLKTSILSLLFLFSYSYGSEITNKISPKCDQIIDKKYFQICYSYKNKGALAGWTRLYGEKVNSVNIKRKPSFYSEKNLPLKYRTKSKDYTGTGKIWNRGHFIVADADMDFDKKALSKSYTMAQIQPMAAKVNQKNWLKIEEHTRTMAVKLGYIDSISIANYDNPKGELKRGLVIPSGFWRILLNKKKNYLSCFYVENNPYSKTKEVRLEDHIIKCENIKI